MTRLYLIAVAMLCFSGTLCAFTGSITYAVHKRHLDDNSFEVRDYSIKYFIDENKAVFDRETALGVAHCVYEIDQLSLDLDLFGEARRVTVQPNFFFAFQEGQTLKSFEENGESKLFRGKSCKGYDLFFEGNDSFVGKAFVMPGMQNMSFDLPQLPGMPVFFEVLNGFEVFSYRAIGFEEGEWPNYLKFRKKVKKEHFGHEYDHQ